MLLKISFGASAFRHIVARLLLLPNLIILCFSCRCNPVAALTYVVFGHRGSSFVHSIKLLDCETSKGKNINRNGADFNISVSVYRLPSRLASGPGSRIARHAALHAFGAVWKTLPSLWRLHSLFRRPAGRSCASLGSKSLRVLVSVHSAWCRSGFGNLFALARQY